MPYIPQRDRDKARQHPITCGELNYAFTELIKGYVKTKTLSYQTINDIVGALEGAKMEFTRRVTNDYEDKKIRDNGDVY